MNVMKDNPVLCKCKTANGNIVTILQPPSAMKPPPLTLMVPPKKSTQTAPMVSSMQIVPASTNANVQFVQSTMPMNVPNAQSTASTNVTVVSAVPASSGVPVLSSSVNQSPGVKSPPTIYVQNSNGGRSLLIRPPKLKAMPGLSVIPIKTQPDNNTVQKLPIPPAKTDLQTVVDAKESYKLLTLNDPSGKKSVVLVPALEKGTAQPPISEIKTNGQTFHTVNTPAGKTLFMEPAKPGSRSSSAKRPLTVVMPPIKKKATNQVHSTAKSEGNQLSTKQEDDSHSMLKIDSVYTLQGSQFNVKIEPLDDVSSQPISGTCDGDVTSQQSHSVTAKQCETQSDQALEMLNRSEETLTADDDELELSMDVDSEGEDIPYVMEGDEGGGDVDSPPSPSQQGDEDVPMDTADSDGESSPDPYWRLVRECAGDRECQVKLRRLDLRGKRSLQESVYLASEMKYWAKPRRSRIPRATKRRKAKSALAIARTEKKKKKSKTEIISRSIGNDMLNQYIANILNPPAPTIKVEQGTPPGRVVQKLTPVVPQAGLTSFRVVQPNIVAASGAVPSVQNTPLTSLVLAPGQTLIRPKPMPTITAQQVGAMTGPKQPVVGGISAPKQAGISQTRKFFLVKTGGKSFLVPADLKPAVALPPNNVSSAASQALFSKVVVQNPTQGSKGQPIVTSILPKGTPGQPNAKLAGAPVPAKTVLTAVKAAATHAKAVPVGVKVKAEPITSGYGDESHSTPSAGKNIVSEPGATGVLDAAFVKGAVQAVGTRPAATPADDAKAKAARKSMQQERIRQLKERQRLQAAALDTLRKEREGRASILDNQDDDSD